MRIHFSTLTILSLLAPLANGFRAPSQASRRGVQLQSSIKDVSESSQLAQLASMTTLSIDSGDLAVIKVYADTGYITDATTNPLFVSQAGLSGDPVYAAMVDDAVAYALKESGKNADVSSIVSLAID